jgi:hypothetical protein
MEANPAADEDVSAADKDVLCKLSPQRLISKGESPDLVRRTGSGEKSTGMTLYSPAT